MPIIDPGTGPLSAVIEYQGTSYRYDEATGTDLGDYTDPLNRFVQGCIRVTHDQLPLTVFFRADRGSHRAEAVFELGRIWSKTPPANLDAYRVTIMRGGREVYTTDVPHHFWFSRWRWQSAPRPVTAKVADLISSGLLPHYDDRVNNGTAVPTHPQVYQIMELSGIARYMPTTGERDDIGPVTECQAEFICTERKPALETVLAQGEAAGTLPWHFRDENTGAPIDTLHYVKASIYPPPAGNPSVASAKTGITIDSAHQPAVAYLPFLLTGDPYHLETLQFQVTANILMLPPGARYRIVQVRSYAWSIRTLGQAARVVPDATPQWLLPRTYFVELLNRQRDSVTRTFLQSNDVERTVFRSMDDGAGGNQIAIWEEDFQTFILGWLVQMGHTDWDPIFRWTLGSAIARTNGTSGWIRARPTAYNIAFRENATSPWMQSWGEAWTLNATLHKLDYIDPNRLQIDKNLAITYPGYLRGALAMGVRLGVAEAVPSFEWIDGEFKRYLTSGVRLEYKWSVA